MSTTASRQAGSVAFVLSLTLAASCRDAAPNTAAPPPDPSAWRLRVEYGDDQSGQAAEDALEPLVVSLRDQAGRPVPGVTLAWAADGDGVVHPEAQRTGSDGRIRAWWTLGSTASFQSATVTGPAGQHAIFHARARLAPDIPPYVLRQLVFDTFDSTGQVVHPDVVGLPFAWDGGRARLAMAITPYPYGNSGHENPSLFVSGNGLSWSPPEGATNPVVLPKEGYLSDPSVLYNPGDHHLWMYYREVAAGENIIYLTTSEDGVVWDPPREVVRVPAHHLVSPSVVRRGSGEWLMWSIDGGAGGCNAPDAYLDLRRSSDGVTWGPPVRAQLDQPGGYPWHVDVQWIRGRREYWALYNLKPAGSCVTPALYLATSSDGLQWTTYPTPVLQRNALSSFRDVVYRSSFMYTRADDAVTFYYSGARWDGTGYVWSAAIERRERQALFADLARAPTAQLMRARTRLPDPEEPRRRPHRHGRSSR